MIDNDEEKIIGNVNSKDAPEEVFTEGYSDLIIYNGIVKFNIFSRPIHSKEFLNTKKVNKTLTFTLSNFEKFLDELNKDYVGIKKEFGKQKNEDKNLEDKNNEIKPPKGSRLL